MTNAEIEAARKSAKYNVEHAEAAPPHEPIVPFSHEWHEACRKAAKWGTPPPEVLAEVPPEVLAEVPPDDDAAER